MAGVLFFSSGYRDPFMFLGRGKMGVMSMAMDMGMGMGMDMDTGMVGKHCMYYAEISMISTYLTGIV